MKFGTRLTCVALACALLLGGSALAADDTAAKRQADLDALYSELQQRHPNIYANATAAEFEAKKAEIEARLAGESDEEFALDLQSFVALIGDSHTTTQLGAALQSSRTYPFSLSWYGDKWVLSLVDKEYKALLEQEIVSIGGLSMDEVTQRMATLLSADNPVKLRRQLGQVVYSEAVLAYLGVAVSGEPLELVVKDAGGKETVLKVEAISMEEEQTTGADRYVSLKTLRERVPATVSQKKYYFSLPLDDKTYYIQYNRCQEDPELPMEDFAAQVRKDLEAGTYTKLLLDLRNNGGGSDGVLAPILALLPDLVRSGVKVYGLIGETTFSSAVINAVMIQEAGGVLAGSPTSGSVNHFGSVRSFTLPNSGIQVNHSSKYIDLGTLLEAGLGAQVDSLMPQYAVDQTLADYLAGRDTLVEDLLKNGDAYTPPEQPEATLTRGRLAWLLWQGAGSPQAGACSYGDVMFFAYYERAVAWCAQEGIVTGVPGGACDAVRPVTVQEAALMLQRYAGAMGLAPEAERETPAEAAHATAPWAAGAVDWLWSWSDLAPGFSPAGTLTRAQGAALVEALA